MIIKTGTVVVSKDKIEIHDFHFDDSDDIEPFVHILCWLEARINQEKKKLSDRIVAEYTDGEIFGSNFGDWLNKQ